MSALGISQKRMAVPLPKVSQKKTAKSKLNITNKFQAQVSQETILEAETDELLDNEEYTEKETFSEEDDTEHLIEYNADELDIDNDDDFDTEKRESVFDSSDDEVFHNIRPDIVIEEVVSTGRVSNSALSVHIPSKVRYLTGTASQEHEIRTDALERIGRFLAEQDKGFLLNDDFDAGLITAKKQKDIARLVGKDETWITRLKQSCIVQTPRWGLQPLFLFFPEEIPSSMKDHSEAVIRHIDNEDPLNPLTIEDLASLISRDDSEYRSLSSNAGSKLRRILEKLSVPPPHERLILAKVFAAQLVVHKDVGGPELIKIVKKSGKMNLSQLLNKYRSFSDKLIEKLKNKELIK